LLLAAHCFSCFLPVICLFAALLLLLLQLVLLPLLLVGVC